MLRTIASVVALAAIFGQMAAVLVPSEIAALVDIYRQCGGTEWTYNAGTEPFNRSSPAKWLDGDACDNQWFGVGCDPTNTHVVRLFPNPRLSGNPLKCDLPASIGNLTYLEELYTSNDLTPSSLTGQIPFSLYSLTRLRCLYFSHNQMQGPIPAEMSKLTNLQGLFLRANNFSSIAPLRGLNQLEDFWVDSNFHMTGTIGWAASLPKLTKLRAFLTQLSGVLPQEICNIEKCSMFGNHFQCPIPQTGGKNCCEILQCTNSSSPVDASREAKAMVEHFQAHIMQSFTDNVDLHGSTKTCHTQ